MTSRNRHKQLPSSFPKRQRPGKAGPRYLD